MPETPAGWALLAAAVLFVGFLLLKSRVALLPRDPEVLEVRRRISEAKQRAREAPDEGARAAAWREAARLALEELGRPGLAATYAKRAGQADPEDVEAVAAVVRALRHRRRHRSLERFLWKRLDGPPGAAYERAFEELLKLYDGPLRRPERAAALRAMRQRPQPTS